ncbi:MAG: YhcH/YjgK/YiaL family protein [Desulfatirhabdiaceae bacterium]
MIHDVLENWSTYFESPVWIRVLEFIAGLSPLSEENNRIEIDGENMYAAIMSYQTCDPRDSILEAHDVYIDIQMSLVNAEAIDWYPRSGLEVHTAYDPAKERTLFHRPAGPAPARVANLPGRFTVLFPQDAHMPKLMTGTSSELVKKVVVKLNVAALKNR